MTTIESVYAVEGVEEPNLESSRSAVSWGAIIGGAIGALTASLILLALGSALGLSAVSPWTSTGSSVAAVGVGAAIWLVIVQWLSSAFGGYLTGRLRTKWAAIGSDEVFFRDTAHGFLSWALATSVVFVLLATIAGGGAGLTATVASGAAQGAGSAAASSGAMGYFTDTLFRRPAGEGAAAAPVGAPAAAPVNSGDLRAESGRILVRGLASGLSDGDRTYLAQLVAQETGLSQADAEKRVDEVVTAAKADADAARKAAVAVSFLTALSLVVGAFVAAVAGALGGRHRDEL